MADNDSSSMKKEGNFCIGTGIGVAALGVAGATLLGAVCPVCIVATPLLIGAGVVQRIRASYRAGQENESIAGGVGDDRETGK